MDAAVIVALVSIAVALAALVLNIRQVKAMTYTLRQMSHEALMGSQNELATLFLNDPETISWHYGLRGYEIVDETHGRRLTFIYLRLNIHEANFIRHRQKLIDDDVWSGWSKVIEADFKIPEYREVWAVAQQYFSPKFQCYIQQLLRG